MNKAVWVYKQVQHLFIHNILMAYFAIIVRWIADTITCSYRFQIYRVFHQKVMYQPIFNLVIIYNSSERERVMESS